MTTPTLLLSATTVAKLVAAIREQAADTGEVDEVLADMTAVELDQAMDVWAGLLARGHKMLERVAPPEGKPTCRHCGVVLRWCDCRAAHGQPHWADRASGVRWCLGHGKPVLHDAAPSEAAARAQTLHTRREAGHVG